VCPKCGCFNAKRRNRYGQQSVARSKTPTPPSTPMSEPPHIANGKGLENEEDAKKNLMHDFESAAGDADHSGDSAGDADRVIESKMSSSSSAKGFTSESAKRATRATKRQAKEVDTDHGETSP
jgi:hypothetical protein